jgi:hypothetical protein
MLGAPGLLPGWSPYLRNKVRQQATGNLQKYCHPQAIMSWSEGFGA